jgi:GTP-binding protein
MNKTLIDTAEIKIIAGRGGTGIVSFRHEKHVAKGGPDGGDGGNGGNVYFIADNNMATLMDFRGKTVYKAPKGEPGASRNKTGANGEDLYIKVPVGTLIYEIYKERDILVGDLIENGQQVLLANGGFGGRGNSAFKSSTNQTPTQFTRGTAGEVKEIRLEIKLIADVGLIGLPNAGKSTLLNKITNSSAKVASYPFTTIIPNLGVGVLPGGKSVIFADIPGLIEGASEGKGLGDDFLRHVERTRVLVHVIDPLEGFTEDLIELEDSGDFNKAFGLAMAKNSWKNYETIREELKSYGGGLTEKREIVVINKMDITEVHENFEIIKEFFDKKGFPVTGISGVSGAGIDNLLIEVIKVLDSIPVAVSFTTTAPVKVFTLENLPNKRIVFKGKVEDIEG